MINIKDLQMQFRQNRMIYGFILICSVLMGLMQYFTPYSFDDLEYLYRYHDYKEGLIDNLDLTHYSDYFFSHYNHTNGRLGDKFTPLFLLLPKWLFATITGISFLIIYIFSLKLYNSNNNLLGRVLLISILSIILPYWECLFVTAYSVNYIIGAAIILPILYLFLFPKRHSTIILFFICLLSVIAGAWHECFSIPLGIAMCVYLVVYRKNLQSIQILIFIFALLGACFIACSPASYYRYEVIKSISPNIKNLTFGLTYLIIFLCIGIFNLIKIKAHKKSTYNHFFSFSIFTNIVIFINLLLFCLLASYACCRLFFISIILGSIAFIQILPKQLYSKKLLSIIISYCIIIFTIAHLSISIFYQIKYDKDRQIVITQFIESNDGVIFNNLLNNVFNNNYSPIITLKKSIAWEFIPMQGWGVQTFSKYYGGDTDNVLKIVPTALQNATPQNSQCLSEELELFAKDGVLFTTRNHEKATVDMTFQTQDKNTYTVSFYLVKYNSDKLTYLYPHSNWSYAGEKIVDYGIW